MTRQRVTAQRRERVAGMSTDQLRAFAPSNSLEEGARTMAELERETQREYELADDVAGWEAAQEHGATAFDGERW